MYQLTGGLRSGMGYVGVGTTRELREKARFIEITAASVRRTIHMISPLLKNLRTTLWSMLPKTSETTHRMSTSRPHVRGTLMSELSPAIAVF